MSMETQPERTRLAWGRTALAVLVVSTMFLRWAPTAGLIVALPIIASTAFAAALVVVQQRRYARQELATTSADSAVPSILLTAAAVVFLALGGLVTVALR